MVNTFISFILISLDKTRIFSLALLLMVFSFSVTAAQIDVSVDRNSISLNDSFQMIFTATESPDEDPDFSPLKQDFDIINQQKSSQSSWVNGTSSKTISWTLTVMAKRSGQLHIPAISFGDDTSNVLDITVTELSTIPSEVSADDELFLEVSISQDQAYVQSQLLYTVRFYQRVNINQATLSDPELDNAIVENIGQDTAYNTQIKGVNYHVTERNYAIFPQQSGLMTIAPLVLTAQVITGDPRARYNSFFSQQSTQTKRVLSKAIAFEVLPAPASFKGNHWLPAENLSLTETWSNTDLNVNVGEPITRTVTIQATGVTSSQLPEMSVQGDNSQLKVYPDQPVINDHANARGMIASREQKIAYIPSSTGKFELPAIEIPWFNTRTKQMDVAKIPAVSLNAIAANPTSSTSSTEEPVISASEPVIAASPQVTKDASPTNSKTSSIWMWVALLLGLAWLITLGLFFSKRIEKSKPALKSDVPPVKSNDITKKLNAACIDNNPHAAHQALVQWGKSNFNAANLAALSSHCNKDLQDEINTLNQCLYAKESIAWDGSTLWKAFNNQQQNQSKQKLKDEPLSPLYPS